MDENSLSIANSTFLTKGFYSINNLDLILEADLEQNVIYDNNYSIMKKQLKIQPISPPIFEDNESLQRNEFDKNFNNISQVNLELEKNELEKNEPEKNNPCENFLAEGNKFFNVQNQDGEKKKVFDGQFFEEQMFEPNNFLNNNINNNINNNPKKNNNFAQHELTSNNEDLKNRSLNSQNFPNNFQNNFQNNYSIRSDETPKKQKNQNILN
jgi:hypothetical protein